MFKNTTQQAPTWWKQPTFLAFKEAYTDRKARPLFFIGSGISRWAGLDNWKNLLINLAAYHDDTVRRDPIKPKIQALLSAVTSNHTNYQEAGSLLEHSFKQAGVNLWREALNKFLDSPELRSKRSEIHEVIAALDWSRIITTNYDVLLESAAMFSSKRFKVTHPGDKDFTRIESSTEPVIVKIHGDIADADSEIVLSKESYRSLYDKAGKNQTMFARTVGSLLRNSTVILFMGYSHDDPYFKTLFNEEMEQAVRDRVFALVPMEGKVEEFERRIDELSKELQIRFITYGPDEKHHELLEFLQYFNDPEKCDATYRVLAHVKRPTVVMLHCGGTIGAGVDRLKDRDTQSLKVVVKTSRYDLELADFSRKLIRWYQNSYNAGNDLDLDIIWEVLPEESQMFSENATSELWNEVGAQIEKILFKYFEVPCLPEHEQELTGEGKLKDLFDEEQRQYALVYPHDDLTERIFRSDFNNRYILGVVILFGTDTLAFAAPALALSLQHLPCPIIITGANQPPEELQLAARSQFYYTSDAWKNLMTTLYFLQCFGHRLTEVLVCFGDTIHNAINLRKRAIEIIPYGRDLIATRHHEPYTFRNLSWHSQYMFKLIDGIFCNNYYPINSIHYHTLVGPEEGVFADLRHIRRDALGKISERKTVGERFSSVVSFVEVSPAFPPIDVKRMISGSQQEIRAVLVEGYTSGTYPSSRRNYFSQFLKDLYENGIPAVLVSQYGILASQQEYETNSAVVEDIPVLRLYGIIPETALPLLSLLLPQISDEDWKREVENKSKLVESRMLLIKQKLDLEFQVRRNIISQEFEDITKKDKMYEKLITLHVNSKYADDNRKSQYQKRGSFRKSQWSKKSQESELQIGSDVFIILSRKDFILFLNEIIRPYERVGAAPDGFEIICNMGFELGLPLLQSYRPEVDVEPRGHKKPFFDQDDAVQKDWLKKANTLLEKVTSLIRAAAVADLRVQDITMEPDILNYPGIQPLFRSFTLPLLVKRHVMFEKKDEKYNVVTYTAEEAAFFAKLSQGCTLESEAEQHFTKLKETYLNLQLNTWIHALQVIDWLIIGIFKGVTCGLAQFLRFDQLAIQSIQVKDPGYIRTLRQATKCNVLCGDEEFLKLEFQYFEQKKTDRAVSPSRGR